MHARQSHSRVPVANVPEKTYIDLIGREEEFNQVLHLLDNIDRTVCISLVGTGGIGKTALAIEVFHHCHDRYEQISSDDRFDYLIWTSAKIEDYTPTGRRRRDDNERQSTLSDIYRTISEVMGIGELRTAEAEALPDIIQEIFTHHRILLVIDNFETIVDNDAVIEFVDALSRTRAKVIITCRLEGEIETLSHKAIHLGVLQDDIARPLLMTTLKSQPDLQLSDDLISDIVELSRGIPLVMTWAAGCLQRGDSWASVKSRLSRNVVDLSLFCYEDSLAAIRGREAYDLLLALAVISAPVTEQALGDVTGLDMNIGIRDKEIKLLTDLTLVSRRRDRKLVVAPLAQEVVLSAVESATLAEIRARWAQHYYEYTAGNPAITKYGRADRFLRDRRLIDELDIITSLMESLEKQNASLFVELLESLRYILYSDMDWITRDRWMRKGVRLSISQNEFCRAALFTSDLAWTEMYRRRLTKSSQAFQDTLAILSNCRQNYYKAKVLKDYGRFLHISNAKEEAEEILHEALQYAQSSDCHVPEEASSILYYLGLLYYDNVSYPFARSHFEDGLAIAERFGATREIQRHLHMIGAIVAHEGDINEARRLIRQAVNESRKYNDLIRVADYQMVLAKIEIEAGFIEPAQAMLAEAKQIYNDLGRVYDVELVDQINPESTL